MEVGKVGFKGNDGVQRIMPRKTDRLPYESNEEKSKTAMFMVGATIVAGITAAVIAAKKGKLGKTLEELANGGKKVAEDVNPKPLNKPNIQKTDYVSTPQNVVKPPKNEHATVIETPKVSTLEDVEAEVVANPKPNKGHQAIIPEDVEFEETINKAELPKPINTNVEKEMEYIPEIEDYGKSARKEAERRRLEQQQLNDDILTIAALDAMQHQGKTASVLEDVLQTGKKGESLFTPHTDELFSPHTDELFTPKTDNLWEPHTDNLWEPHTDELFTPKIDEDLFGRIDEIDSGFNFGGMDYDGGFDFF